MLKRVWPILFLLPCIAFADAIDPNSPEMRLAERLLDNPEALLERSGAKETIACFNGECDQSKEELSDDSKEGVSRLGALAGSAGEISLHQVTANVPAIFVGTAKECKKYPLGFRDCCADNGWGEWVKHCPADLQQLQKAKAENRVVYLGHYQKNKLSARHYTYCIFPTKLAAIVQIQGRGGQLGLSYGTAKQPNCRGLTPEELERIHFDQLDLSPIQQELMSRMVLPTHQSLSSRNQAQVERWYKEQRAYD